MARDLDPSDPTALPAFLAWMANRVASASAPPLFLAELERFLEQRGITPISLALAATGPDPHEAWLRAQRILAHLSERHRRSWPWADALTTRPLVRLSRHCRFGEDSKLSLDIFEGTGIALPDGLWVPGSLRLERCRRLERLGAGTRVGGHLILVDCSGLGSLPADLAVRGVLDLRGSSLPTPVVGDPIPTWMCGPGLVHRTARGGILRLGRSPQGRLAPLPEELDFGSYPL